MASRKHRPEQPGQGDEPNAPYFLPSQQPTRPWPHRVTAPEEPLPEAMVPSPAGAGAAGAASSEGSEGGAREGAGTSDRPVSMHTSRHEELELVPLTQMSSGSLKRLAVTSALIVTVAFGTAVGIRAWRKRAHLDSPGSSPVVTAEATPAPGPTPSPTHGPAAQPPARPAASAEGAAPSAWPPGSAKRKGSIGRGEGE